MVFSITRSDSERMGHALARLDVSRFAAAHQLSLADETTLKRARHARFDADFNDPSLARAFGIVSGCSPLLTAVRASLFTPPLSNALQPEPVAFLKEHIKAERERIRYYESPPNGPMRTADLLFKPLALTALAYALQELGDGPEAEKTYDLAEVAAADIENDTTLELFEDLFDDCHAGRWNEPLYYKLCGDFPGFIQARIADAQKAAESGKLTEALDILLKANTSFHADRARGLVHLAGAVMAREALHAKRAVRQKQPRWNPPQREPAFTEAIRCHGQAFGQYLEDFFQRAGYELTGLVVDKPFHEHKGPGTNQSQLKVYAAIDRSIRQPVIIRWSHKPLAEEGAALIQEVQNHPRFPKTLNQVLQVGELPYGSYSVLEFIEGTKLEALFLKRPNHSLTFLAKILKTLLFAEASLNALGITQGDIGTHNTIMTRDGKLRIFDYGLSSKLIPDKKNPLRQLANVVSEYLFAGQQDHIHSPETFTRYETGLSLADVLEVFSQSLLFQSLTKSQQQSLALFTLKLLDSPQGTSSFPNAMAALEALQKMDWSIPKVLPSDIVEGVWPEFLDPDKPRHYLKTSDGCIATHYTRIRRLTLSGTQGGTELHYKFRAVFAHQNGRDVGNLIVGFSKDPDNPDKWIADRVRLKITARGQRYGMELMVQAIRMLYENTAISKIVLTGILQGKFLLRFFDGIRLSTQDIARLHQINDEHHLGIDPVKLTKGLTPLALTQLVNLGAPNPSLQEASHKAFRSGARSIKETMLATQYPGLIAFLLLGQIQGTLDLTTGSRDYKLFETSVEKFWRDRTLPNRRAHLKTGENLATVTRLQPLASKEIRLQALSKLPTRPIEGPASLTRFMQYRGNPNMPRLAFNQWSLRK